MNEIFCWFECNKDIITTISAALGVFIAAFAIFYPYIVKHCNRPILEISSKKLDDATFTGIKLIRDKTISNAISLKLDVENNGKSEAENVQIALNKITRDNNILPTEPLKLFWSYQDENVRLHLSHKTRTSILAGSHAHCDFLFLIVSKTKNHVREAWLASQVDQFNKLEKSGHYKIKLALSSKGIKTTFWLVSFDLNKGTNKKDEIVKNFKVIPIEKLTHFFQ